MDKNGGLIAVALAVVSTAGVVATAYFNAKPAARAEGPTPTPSPAPTPTPTPSPTPSPTPTPAPTPTPTPTTPAPTALTPSPDPTPTVKDSVAAIGGTWVDGGGLPYVFGQDGANFRLTGGFNGILVAGAGAVINREVRWTYQNNIGGSGQCAGMIAAGDRSMTVGCQQMNGPPYQMLLTRTG